jgi:hypothetical protein
MAANFVSFILFVTSEWIDSAILLAIFVTFLFRYRGATADC